MSKNKSIKKRKRGYQNPNRYNTKTQFWISSNNNDFIQKEEGIDVYFMVEYIEKVEDREKFILTTNIMGNSVSTISIPHKTTILTELEFRNIKGFVPIKAKKFQNSRSNGRFGTRSFGHVRKDKNEVEKAINRNKIEIREERLKKLLD